MTTELANPTNQNNAAACHDAALQGATLAFAKPVVKPKPNIQSINTYQGSSQALAAATLVGSRPSSASRTWSATHMASKEELSTTPQYSGVGNLYGSAGEGQEQMKKPRQLVKTGSLDYLQPQKSAMIRPASPSHIAATLAISRSSSTSPSRTTHRPVPASFTEQAQADNFHPSTLSIRNPSPSRSTGNDILDAFRLPTTKSLIGMCERAAINRDPAEGSKPGIVPVGSLPSEIKHPRPVRPQRSIVKKEPVQSEKSMPSTPRMKRSALEPPHVSPTTDKKGDIEDEVSSDDSFVSATDQIATLDQKNFQSLGYKQPIFSTSNRSLNSMTVDSFANAIVASSLASSRAESPASPTLRVIPPPPPPTRRGNSGFFHLNNLDARTPSPAKGLRQTMRKPPKVDDDLDKQRRGRKNIMIKHSNKQNEGHRKRWRDSVTERERKRYEAVWASNKGLFVSRDIALSFPPPLTLDTYMGNLRQENFADLVSNIVVRDIWSRSRLGNDVLAEVWKLVDRTGLGRLAREEFVAGMWLIDQRLKGRKLPIRISPSVWASVGGLGGVKIRSNGRQR